MSFAISLVILPLTAFTGVLLARALGPSGRGALAAVLLWAGLASYLGNLGVPGAVAFFVARDPANAAGYATTGLIMAAGLGPVIAVVGALLMPFALHRLGPGVVLIAALYMVSVPLSIAGTIGAGALQGASRLSLFNILRLLPVVLGGVGLLYLTITKQLTVVTAAFTYIGVAVVSLAVTLVLMHRAHLLEGNGRRALVRPIAIYGLKAHTGTVSGVANDRADQALISVFLSASALGYYTAAVASTALIMLVGTSVALVAFPAVAGLVSDPEAQRIRAARLVRLTFLLSAGSAVVIVPLTPLLIRTLFGAAFLPAAIPAQLLMVATVVATTNRVTATCLNAIGQPLQSGYGELIATVVTVVGLVILVPMLGIIGAAVTSLIAYVVTFAYITSRLRQYTAASYADFVWPRRGDFDWAKGALRLRR